MRTAATQGALLLGRAGSQSSVSCSAFAPMPSPARRVNSGWSASSAGGCDSTVPSGMGGSSGEGRVASRMSSSENAEGGGVRGGSLRGSGGAGSSTRRSGAADGSGAAAGTAPMAAKPLPAAGSGGGWMGRVEPDGRGGGLDRFGGQGPERALERGRGLIG